MDMQLFARFFLFVVIALMTPMGTMTALQGDSPALSSDLLVYTVTTPIEDRAAFLYDPLTGQNTPILEDHVVSAMEFNRDGRLVFQYAEDPLSAPPTYIADVLNPQSTPVLLNDVMDVPGYIFPLGWSPDGQNFAFANVPFEFADLRLYVWDGNALHNLIPGDMAIKIHSGNATWSADNLLAFTIIYQELGAAPASLAKSDIFIWDGTSTINLTQDPDGFEDDGVWSNDGRLAFYFEEQTGFRLYVWDSQTSGSRLYPSDFVLPDTYVYSSPDDAPTWTPDGRLVVAGVSNHDSFRQIYAKGNEIYAVNLSQLPERNNSDARWATDGRWAFISSTDTESTLYVRDAENTTVLETEAKYAPAWSPNGLLMFCTPDGEGWALKAWDGAEVTTVARGERIVAQWQGGDGVNCFGF